MRVALGRLLRLAGYEVAAFDSGEAFLGSLGARVPCCALVDVHMPGLSGFEVYSRMRGAKLAVPVVFISASDDAALSAKVAEAGGVALLRKPFSNEALLESVAAALRARACAT